MMVVRSNHLPSKVETVNQKSEQRYENSYRNSHRGWSDFGRLRPAYPQRR